MHLGIPIIADDKFTQTNKLFIILCRCAIFQFAGDDRKHLAGVIGKVQISDFLRRDRNDRKCLIVFLYGSTTDLQKRCKIYFFRPSAFSFKINITWRGLVSLVVSSHPIKPDGLGSNQSRFTGFNLPTIITVGKLLTYSCLTLHIYSSMPKHDE